MRASIESEEHLTLARNADMAEATRLDERFTALSHEIEIIAERAGDMAAGAEDAAEAREHHQEATGLLMKGRDLLDDAQRRRTNLHPSARKRTATLLMDCAIQLRLADEALDRAAIFGADSGSSFRP